MLQRLIASRIAGPLLLAFVALLVAAVGVQTARLGSSQALAQSRAETIGSQMKDIANMAASIRQRDTLIASQNAGIDSLAKAATAGREVYLTTYAKADERAKDDDGRAAELLAMTVDRNTDELAQCRASKLLLEGELGL